MAIVSLSKLFFLLHNLNEDMYLKLIQDINDPSLTDIIEDDEHYLKNQLIFQQDGTPPHYARLVREHLNKIFPCRWIEKNSIE